MIFVGYQGIGKSTLARNGARKLPALIKEKSFRIDGKYIANWKSIYIAISNHLAEQGIEVMCEMTDDFYEETLNRIDSCSQTPCIDLESSCFWVNGVRNPKWYVVYVAIAKELSDQGYAVFTSSHEVVREEIKLNGITASVIFPSVDLKYQWIAKLEQRYHDTGLDKDYKAMMNAKDRYDDNIRELATCGLMPQIIIGMDYDLREIVEYVIANKG